LNLSADFKQQLISGLLKSIANFLDDIIKFYLNQILMQSVILQF